MAATYGESCSLESQQFRAIQAEFLQGHTRIDDDVPAALPDFHNVASPSLTRKAGAGAPPNPLMRSAPEMTALLQDSLPDQEHARERATSLPVNDANSDGDTQPMPVDVYANYRPAKSIAFSPGRHVDFTQEETEGNTFVNGTPAKRETVDLLAGWETQPAEDGNIDVHSIRESTEDDMDGHGLVSSYHRESQLKTPAVTGQKRDRYGHTISSSVATKTPGSGLTNIFGRVDAKPLMTNTQLFENTQGRSSPLGGEMIRSDPAETRPSPGFNYTTTISPSVHAISSPSKPTQAPSSSANAGPRDKYRRMEESQKRRARVQSFGPAPTSSKVVFDDESQEQLEAPSSLAPARFRSSLAAPKPLLQTRHTTTAASAPYSLQRRASASQEPPQIIELSDNHSDSADDESIDEYDELEQDVRPSQKRISSQNSLYRSDTPEMLEDETEVAGSPLDGRMAAPSATKPSQGLSGRLLEPSSMSSFVPGSQFPPLSTQSRALLLRSEVSSSIPQPPPKSLPQTGTLVSNLPSSPPIANTQLSHFEDDRPLSNDLKVDQEKRTQEPRRPSQRSDNEERHHTSQETDAPASDKPALADHTNETIDKASDCTSSAVYETAASHVPVVNSVAGVASARSRLVSESPQKAGPMKLFKDFSNEPTSQMSISEIDTSVGIEALREKDEQYLELMKTPTKPTRSTRSAPRQKTSPKSPIANPPAPSEVAGQSSKAQEPAGELAKIVDLDDVDEQPPCKRRKLARTYAKRGMRPKSDAPATIPEMVQSSLPTKSARSSEANPSADVDMTHVADHDPAQQAEDTPDQGLPKQTATTEPRTGDNPDEAPLGKAATVASAEDDTKPKLRPERVLALFNGSVTGYYPATFLNTSSKGTQSRLNVRFDDGTCTTLEQHHVCAFELRIDDLVKVDLPKMRTHMYTVVGFEDAAAQGEQTLTDVHGHGIVKVRMKPKESSRHSKVKFAVAAIDETISIPIGSVYVTQSMWVKYETRRCEQSVPTTRQDTPSVELTAPPTPSSRTRRQTLNSGSLSHFSSTAVPFSIVGGAFTNMAFAVSFEKSSDLTVGQREAIVRQIRAQGGTILEEGIHELFEPVEISKLNDKHSAPSSLRVKSEHSTLGFVAIIADSFSRKPKYIQALALSLPTLHYRWVQDSITANRALPWSRYLLPAGQSDHLNKAIRSRCLTPYSPTTALFSNTVSKRDYVLRAGHDSGVILFDDTSKSNAKLKRPSGKHESTRATTNTDAVASDMRQTFAFLSLAMGASKVSFADSPAQLAAAIVPGAGWAHIHCPREEGMRLAASTLGHVEHPDASGAAAHQRVGAHPRIGQKRRHSLLGVSGATAEETDGRDVQYASRLSISVPWSRGHDGHREAQGSTSEARVRIVCNEWVIQSLILGP